MIQSITNLKINLHTAEALLSSYLVCEKLLWLKERENDHSGKGHEPVHLGAAEKRAISNQLTGLSILLPEAIFANSP